MDNLGLNRFMEDLINVLERIADSLEYHQHFVDKDKQEIAENEEKRRNSNNDKPPTRVVHGF